MRLSRILIIALVSTMVTLPYAQGDDQVQRDIETRNQALQIFAEIGSKYQLLNDPAREGAGKPPSSIPPANPSLLEQIGKVVVNSRMFEGAYRASKAVLSGTEAGVSYRDYGNLIQPLLAEASILKDTAITPDEQLLAQAYVDAANIYAATGRFWSATLGHDIDVQTVPWTIARAVLTKANEAYLRNYRSELSPHPATTPQPIATPSSTAKKAKRR